MGSCNRWNVTKTKKSRLVEIPTGQKGNLIMTAKNISVKALALAEA